MKKIYPVTNLSCANCALGVEKKLNQQRGVKSAQVNFASNIATIDYDPSQTDPEALRDAVRSIGYDMIVEGDEEDLLIKQERETEKRYRKVKRNTILSWLFSLLIMAISMSHLHGWFDYIQLALAIPVIGIFGRDFYIRGWKHAVNKSPNMDTLVALSTSIAFLFSLFTTFFPTFWQERGMDVMLYYEASTMIIAFVLLGKLLEERAKGKSSSAIRNLMGLQPNVATVVKRSDDGSLVYEVTKLADLKIDNLILVKPGERIAVDGVVTEGESFVDESAVTGESVASEKRTGEKVVSGSINVSGPLVFKAERVGQETVLSQIIKVVRESQASKAPVQRIVDKVAAVFVPIVAVASLLTFVLWITIGGVGVFSMALVSAISVLVIACPCAMGLATPTALMVGIGKAAQNHILIKDATAIEQMRRVNTVVLDKTGTITTGKPAVTDWIWMESDQSGYLDVFTRDEFRSAISSMEMRSEHPLASAVVSYLKTEGVMPTEVLESFQATAGHGVSASYRGKNIWAGNLRLAVERCGEDYQSKKESFKSEGKSILFMGIENRCVAVAAIADKVKESSAEAVRELKKLGIDVHMLTGDNESVASGVAKSTGVSHYLSGVLPAEKQEYVTKLQKEGRVVAMVGDGINDSQALSVADVSIAMGKGTDIAMDVAMMTLITSDLRLLPAAFAISERTVRLIHQNLFWAFFYNVIGIPIAAGLLYPFTGIMLNPMIAAAAMAFSSVSVVLNSLRLGRFNYHPKG